MRPIPQQFGYFWNRIFLFLFYTNRGLPPTRNQWIRTPKPHLFQVNPPSPPPKSRIRVKRYARGGSRIFLRRKGTTKEWPDFWPGNKIMWTAENTYQTTGCSRFCITVLGSHRSSPVGEGAWGAHPLHPTPRSAPVCGFKNVLIRVDGAWVACVAADSRNVYTIGSVYTLYTGDLECLRRRRLGLS